MQIKLIWTCEETCLLKYATETRISLNVGYAKIINKLLQLDGCLQHHM